MASLGQIIFCSMITLIILFSTIIILVLALTFSHRAPEVLTHNTFPIANLGTDQLLSCLIQQDKEETKITRVSVTWGKVGLQGYVYRFLDGGPDLQRQNPEFQGRTQLFPNLLVSGNASLLLRNVQKKDEGVYTCNVDTSDGGGNVHIELRTAAFTAPTFTFSQDILSAKANRWFPKPNVTWMNHDNQVLEGTTRLTQNTAGIYSVYTTLQPINVSQTYVLQIENDLVTSVSKAEITGLNVTVQSYFIFNKAPFQLASIHLSIASCIVCIYYLM